MTLRTSCELYKARNDGDVKVQQDELLTSPHSLERIEMWNPTCVVVRHQSRARTHRAARGAAGGGLTESQISDLRPLVHKQNGPL